MTLFAVVGASGFVIAIPQLIRWAINFGLGAKVEGAELVTHGNTQTLIIASVAVIGAAVAMGLASLVVLWRRWYVLAPPVAAGTVALVIAGWGAAQHPYFILPDERISDVAASDATLAAFLISLAIGALILIPSLALLFLVFSEKTGGAGVEHEGYEY